MNQQQRKSYREKYLGLTVFKVNTDAGVLLIEAISDRLDQDSAYGKPLELIRYKESADNLEALRNDINFN